jgi:DNA repair exonuclease SbcCD ATPase subunit
MNALLITARQPLHIAVLLVAIVTGLLVESWLLPLGIIVYVAAVVIASRDTTLQVKAAQQASRQGITSTTFNSKLDEIERSQAEVIKALQRTGGPAAARLAPSLEPQTRELVEQAYTLAQRGQDIEHYLSRFNRSTLQDQIKRLDQRVQRTTDQYTIDQLQSTREALERQLENAQVLETYIGRIKSQLDNIDANLDAMPAQLMRMHASDVDSTTASSQVAQHLSDLNADMSAFVSVLDNALNQTRAA